VNVIAGLCASRAPFASGRGLLPSLIPSPVSIGAPTPTSRHRKSNQRELLDALRLQATDDEESHDMSDADNQMGGHGRETGKDPSEENDPPA
jgi:hypothetical protein